MLYICCVSFLVYCNRISFEQFSPSDKHKFLGYIQCKATMPQLCDLAIHVNGQQIFFLNQKILSAYSGKLKKIIGKEKRKSQIKNLSIGIDNFPGGPDGFEMVSRFCYNHGKIKITVSNVALLHCCAVFLGMTENLSPGNLLKQTETFLDGMIHWSLHDIIASLKSCESFFTYSDTSGLVEKLIFSLLEKLAQNSVIATLIASSSSSSSSPETASRFRFSSSAKTTPESTKPGSSSKQWWFDDLIILPPMIIEKIIANMGACGTDNNSFILTKFLLHYLKNAVLQCKGGAKSTVLYSRADYAGLAGTAVHGVSRNSFSCRGLFSVLRIVSGCGLSRDCRAKLERLIGGMLDQATLDDLLISGHDDRGVFDVNLVIRLVRIFVNSDFLSSQKLKKVGRLIDKYLCEISPDQNLETSKLLGVAESLPDSARDCFDGVYRAIDIYLESHPTLSFEERSRLCSCLNFGKMSLEACKDLAKNPRIPPNIAVQALKSQHSKIPQSDYPFSVKEVEGPSTSSSSGHMVLHSDNVERLSQETQEMRMNIQRMQWRVMELENACREMKGRISKVVRHDVNVMSSTPPYNYSRSPFPRLC
ncbi:BTB/POZ domain-containing protein At3g19850-like isoform X1 [Populus nigra]|uniref:BTB/POZ domain-containing protein At3g19850-like isoform X1 n=2 Tax=Populus nigra TaxID=3691 RepID=UPI002B277E75|nr:BTB/POZ domain-containing protein At3g19850-like isoform X1 [Populus nigra]